MIARRRWRRVGWRITRWEGLGTHEVGLVRGNIEHVFDGRDRYAVRFRTLAWNPLFVAFIPRRSTTHYFLPALIFGANLVIVSSGRLNGGTRVVAHLGDTVKRSIIAPFR